MSTPGITHHRHSTRMTSCGKPWRNRPSSRKWWRKKVSTNVEEVSCSTCIEVLAEKVQAALDPSPWEELFRIRQKIELPPFPVLKIFPSTAVAQMTKKRTRSRRQV